MQSREIGLEILKLSRVHGWDELQFCKACADIIVTLLLQHTNGSAGDASEGLMILQDEMKKKITAAAPEVQRIFSKP